MAKTPSKATAFLGFSAAILIAAVVVLRARSSPVHETETLPCIRNLKDLSVSMLIYSMDTDEHLPPSKWMTALTPYAKAQGSTLTDSQVLPPNFSHFRCTVIDDAGYGYALKSGLSGKALLKNAVPEVLVFDSSDLRFDAVEPLSTFVARHNGNQMGNVAFTDTSVHRFSPSEAAALR